MVHVYPAAGPPGDLDIPVASRTVRCRPSRGGDAAANRQRPYHLQCREHAYLYWLIYTICAAGGTTDTGPADRGSGAPRHRLPAWMLRDQALALSGLLVAGCIDEAREAAQRRPVLLASTWPRIQTSAGGARGSLWRGHIAAMRRSPPGRAGSCEPALHAKPNPALAAAKTKKALARRAFSCFW